jgi:hypothetical protein
MVSVRPRGKVSSEPPTVASPPIGARTSKPLSTQAVTKISKLAEINKCLNLIILKYIYFII